jgi:hypothetical protein
LCYPSPRLRLFMLKVHRIMINTLSVDKAAISAQTQHFWLNKLSKRTKNIIMKRSKSFPSTPMTFAHLCGNGWTGTNDNLREQGPMNKPGEVRLRGLVSLLFAESFSHNL